MSGQFPGLVESSLRAELEAYKRAYLDFQRRHSALLQVIPGVAKMAELMKSYDVDKLDDIARVEAAIACQDAAEDAARMYFWVRDNEPRALLDQDKEPGL